MDIISTKIEYVHPFIITVMHYRLGRRFGTSKMHLSANPLPPPWWLRLLFVLRWWFCCLLFLQLWESVLVLCFVCTLLYDPSSFAIILIGKRQLVALLGLSSWCLVTPCVALPCGAMDLSAVTVAFPDHTHLLFVGLHIRLDMQKASIKSQC